MKHNFTFIGKTVLDIVPVLIEELGIRTFSLRAYVPKIEALSVVRDFHCHKGFAKEELKQKISSFLKDKDERYLIGLFSKVITERGTYHLPMIDFSNSRVENLDVAGVREVLRRLGEKDGFILNSGRCFHYYGLKLISHEEWMEFVKKCSSFPEIGEKYINHQLERGGCVLRVTTNSMKPKLPEIVAMLE